MPVQEYLDRKVKARRIEDTIRLKVSIAYNRAEATTIREEDGLVNLESLADPSTRDTFYDVFVTSIQNSAAIYAGFTKPQAESLDIFRRNDLMKLYLGINAEQVRGIIDGLKENMNSQAMMQYLQRGLESVIQEKRATALSALSETDAPEAVKYTKTEGRVDPNKLKREDIAELVDRFAAPDGGVISDKFLIGKPYLVQGYDPSNPTNR